MASPIETDELGIMPGELLTQTEKTYYLLFNFDPESIELLSELSFDTWQDERTFNMYELAPPLRDNSTSNSRKICVVENRPGPYLRHVPKGFVQINVYGTDKYILKKECNLRFAVHAEMGTIQARKESFSGRWPHQWPLTPLEMASVGFYYYSACDVVKCFYCGGKLHQWQANACPFKEHKKYYPKCCNIETDDTLYDRIKLLSDRDYRKETFIDKWMPEYNISVDELIDNGFYYLGPTDKVRCVYCRATVRNWSAEDTVMSRHYGFSCSRNAIENISINRDVEIIDNMNPIENAIGITNNRPCNPVYANPQARMESLLQWPPTNAKIKLEDFMKAGFYYKGIQHGDRLHCFHCNLILMNWEDHDNPLQHHKFYRPLCKFIIDLELQDAEEAEEQKEEFKEMKDLLTCKVCLENRIGVLFLPCNHLSCCKFCARHLSNCPICREVIVGSARAFMS